MPSEQRHTHAYDAQFTPSTSPVRGGRDVWLTLKPHTLGFAAISLSMIVPLPTPEGPAKKSAGGPSSFGIAAFAGDGGGIGADVSHEVRFPIAGASADVQGRDAGVSAWARRAATFTHGFPPVCGHC